MLGKGNLKASFDKQTMENYESFRRRNKQPGTDPLHLHAELGHLRNRLLQNYRTIGLTQSQWIELDLYYCRLLGGGNRAED